MLRGRRVEVAEAAVAALVEAAALAALVEAAAVAGWATLLGGWRR